MDDRRSSGSKNEGRGRSSMDDRRSSGSKNEGRGRGTLKDSHGRGSAKDRRRRVPKYSGGIDEPVRLNKYIANSGICSRRDADRLISEGEISVDGQRVTDLGTKVARGAKVRYKGKLLNPEKKVYILLNKPAGYVSTTEDPHAVKIVTDLVKFACSERVYPVGRLDKDTTGLLLFTNDGDLAKKLTHPSHGRKKIYHVHLNRPLTKNDMIRLTEGVDISEGDNAGKVMNAGEKPNAGEKTDDGKKPDAGEGVSAGEKVAADAVAYPDPGDKTQVGLEIHSGQNRVVRRMFESLGYRIKKLDRVYFAGLTKKNLPRGKWRFLTEKEINILKRS
jgi:23S rRNA pseudouridine2605 synthase